jgi:hypothetical protein
MINSLLRKFRSLAIAAPLALALASPLSGVVHADQRDFTLINGSSAVLTHLYVSPTASEEWGEDILGQTVVNPTESVLVYFASFSPGGCGYDILASFSDGGQGKMLAADLCASDSITFSDVPA